MAYTNNPEVAFDHSNSIREDVVDEISIASPVTAPLTYQLGFGEALGQSEFEWLTDFINAPVTDVFQATEFGFVQTGDRRSAYPSGWEAEFPAEETRTRMGNVACIVERTTDVSATLRATLQYGVGDEYGYKVDKRFLEVVEQYDYNAHFGVYNEPTSGATAGSSGANNARMTHGVIPWVFWTGNTTSGSISIGGRSIPRGTFATRNSFSGTWYDNDVNGVAITRARFHENMLEPAYKRGMQIDGSVAFVGAAQKRIISAFAYAYDASTDNTAVAPIGEYNVQARDRYANEGIDVFETNLGTISFNLDRHLDNTTTLAYDTDQTSGAISPNETVTVNPSEEVIILDTRFWEHRILRGIGYTPLAKTGDADKALVVLEAGLQCSNPIGGIVGHEIVTG